MSALSIQVPFPIFQDRDGQPLENGYIWIGTANLDPEGNPINVYFDAALTVQAAQPIRTINGFPSQNGGPARLYAASDYSIRVQDKNGSLVYSAPSATERYASADINYTAPINSPATRPINQKVGELISAADQGKSGGNTIANLVGITPTTDGVVYEAYSYYNGSAATTIGPTAQGRLVWNALRSKADHNGGTVISPTVPWDGTVANLAAFLAGTGETDPSGNGCWERKGISRQGVQIYGGGNGINDSAAVQQAIKVAALTNNNGIIFEQLSSDYKLLDKVLWPSNVCINLNYQTLTGAGSATGIMFESAYVSGSTLITNIGTAVESNPVFRSKIKDGQIKNCGLVFNLYNFIFGCGIFDIDTQNCRQVIKSQRGFYSKYHRITAVGSSNVSYPTFHFKDNANAVEVKGCSATTEFGYHFEGPNTACIISGNTAEGGTIGVKVSGDMLGAKFDGNYLENMPSGGTALDFKTAGTCSIDFKGNYFNLCDIVFDDGGAAGTSTLFGTFDESNFLAGVGATEGGTVRRGLMNINSDRNFIKYKVRAESATTSALPSNWVYSKLSDIEKVQSFGGLSLTDIRAKSKNYGTSIVPVTRMGDIGASFPGRVPFCDNPYGLTPGSSSITVVVDSYIIPQSNALFAKFIFTIVDDVSTYVVFGDIYGGNVIQHDSTGKAVILVTNTFGNLQFRISTFTGSGGAFTCTGSVQIVG